MTRAKYLTASQVRERLRRLERIHDGKQAPAICPYCKGKTSEPRLIRGKGWVWECIGGCNT